MQLHGRRMRGASGMGLHGLPLPLLGLTRAYPPAQSQQAHSLALKRRSSAAAHAEPANSRPAYEAGREVAVLGGEDFIYSQMSGVSEELFKGDKLGVFADIASVDFRQSELRSLAHLPREFAPPERFLERVALHYAKNILVGQGGLRGQVPLILGIWGPKGNGKSFNLELCCRVMGVQPVILSAGELEDELAGEPGRRLRERYRFAVQHACKSGVPTCLIINDLDVGLGRYKNTDNTVNTQNLSGTLMALCDDPCLISTGQEWQAASRAFQRVPIFVTAHSLSIIYAPLMREGRMEKFFFNPSREERCKLLASMFDDLSGEQAEILVDAFPCQPLDFFESIKSRLTDAAVRSWLRGTSLEGMGSSLLGDELLHAKSPGAWRSHPRVQLKQHISLEAALHAGGELAREQQNVMDHNLVREYMKNLDQDPVQLQMAKSRRPSPPPAAPFQPLVVSDEMKDYYSYMASTPLVSMTAEQPEQDDTAADRQRVQLQQSDALRGWRTVHPDWLADAMKQQGKARVIVLDIRSARECEWGKIKGAVHVPFVLTAGSSLNPTTKPNPDFLSAVSAAVPLITSLVVYGSSTKEEAGKQGAIPSPKGVFVSKALSLSDEDFVAQAMEALLGCGYDAKELAGGFKAWDLDYRPDGRRREKGNWADRSSGDLEWWTASN